MAGVLIVDGANVVGSRPDGWWKDRAGAARRLADRLVNGAPLPGDITLVLEGAARRGVPAGPYNGITIVHAPASGDDTIVDLVAAAQDAPVTVVTADRALRDRVTTLGAEVTGPRSINY